MMGMGGYAFGQQGYTPARGALNWNPGYGAGPFMPQQVQSGMRPFQAGPTPTTELYSAYQKYLDSRGGPAQNAMPPGLKSPASGLVNAVAAGVDKDAEEKQKNQQRIDNIRALRMAFLQALTNAGMKDRGLDLQELRLMNQ